MQVRISRVLGPESDERGLKLARLGWFALAGLNLALFLIALPTSLAAHMQSALRYGPVLDQIGLTPSGYAVYRTGLDTLLVIAFTVVGAVIFWRNPGSKLLIWVSLTCITFSSLFVPTLIALIERYPVWTYPVGFVRAFGLVSSLLVFFYLFPDGRFVPRWTLATALLWTGLTTVWFLFPAVPYNIVYLANWTENLPVSVGLLLFWFSSGVIAQSYRYGWVLNPAQRQQTKWAMFGMTMAVMGFALYHLPLMVVPQLQQPGLDRLLYALYGPPVYHLLVLLAPLSIAFAILRHRLWEIDLLINRSLVYGLLTTTLLLVYLASVVVLQALFGLLLAGFRWPSDLANVLSTLLLAGLFFPLRSRIQSEIDRRFYRQRYSAEKALLTFRESLREEMNLNRISSQLLEVVEETIQPNYASLWRRGLDTGHLSVHVPVHLHSLPSGHLPGQPGENSTPEKEQGV